MRIRGPQTFDRFRQRVRRHRRSDVLDATAACAAFLTGARMRDDPRPDLPNVVQPFTLAAIARAAVLYGNDHRDLPVGDVDLLEMCLLYANVEEPAIDEDPGRERLRGLMHRLTYEQAVHQTPERENIGRTLLLFEDHAHAAPTAPSDSDWESLLGVSLSAFMHIGFAMHVAAVSNRGQITRDVLRMPHVTPVFGSTTIDTALGVVDRWFAATADDLRTVGTEAEVRGKEKWSLNPLVARPIVTVGDRYVTPCPRWVIDRFTPTGLYFIGLEAFGAGFPDALGAMFESYVGSQLRLIEHAVVHSEIVYGSHGEKTVDYFVVTREAVVLVEVKSARPTAATRLGDPGSDGDIDKKIGKAFKQIKNSASLLAAGHPSLAHINPDGLPVIGIVVTLEPFYLINTFIHGDLHDIVDVPAVVASAQELETFIGVAYDRADIGTRFLDAVNRPEPEPPTLATATDDLDPRVNPLLDDAWSRFL